jgi:murein DD-endopeptidase MepM/ murein hydrolase activator NlpD
MVRKGQDLALMGSTGRSTGPHLHFEVLKNGVQVDPLRFVGEDR